jgi:hypothetical protein
MQIFLTFNNWAVLKGSVYTVATEPTPLPPSGHEGNQMMRAYYDHWIGIMRPHQGFKI